MSCEDLRVEYLRLLAMKKIAQKVIQGVFILTSVFLIIQMVIMILDVQLTLAPVFLILITIDCVAALVFMWTRRRIEKVAYQMEEERRSRARPTYESAQPDLDIIEVVPLQAMSDKD